MLKRIVIATALLISGTMAAEVNTATGTRAAEEGKRYGHAIEISTGYPSILFQFEYPFFKGDRGVVIEDHYQPGINLAYTFSWGNRWEANALGNLHLTILDRTRYPEIPNSGYDLPEYDYDAEPISASREHNIYGAVAACVRYKWIVREKFSMYSALGVGVQLNGYPIPLPYVAPVGIKFGKGRVYGLAEVNISSANTFGMIGMGIRL